MKDIRTFAERPPSLWFKARVMFTKRGELYVIEGRVSVSHRWITLLDERPIWKWIALSEPHRKHLSYFVHTPCMRHVHGLPANTRYVLL